MHPTKPPTHLPLTPDLLARAEALIAAMAADPEVRALGRPTRTAVLRVALACGLRDLERRYQPQGSAHGSALHPSTPPQASTPRPLEGTLSHVYAGCDGEDQTPGGSHGGSGVSAPAPKGS
jgi:hypothetical protein